MESWFEINLDSFAAIALTALAVYISVIVYILIFGKHSVGKMSGFDYVITITIGSIIGSTITSESVSLWDGLLALLILFFLQFVLATFRRFEWVAKKVDNTPLLLMSGEKVIKKNLKKAQVTEQDIRAELRQANVSDLSQVKAVVFESNGRISVLTGEIGPDDWLLKDVKK